MIKPRRKKNETTEAYNRRASKLYYDNGYYLKEIAQRLNIPEIEVYNYVANGHKITTEDERNEMISLFNQGYSYNAISKIFNRSRSCVKRRIESPAKFVYNTDYELTDRQLKIIADMAKEDDTIEHIAQTLGIDMRYVKYRLRHIAGRKHITYVTEEEHDEFIRLYKKGKSYKTIAKECGRSVSTVARHLHDAGYWRSREK